MSSNLPNELFEIFVNAQTFEEILHSFDNLCRSLEIDRTLIGYNRRLLYKTLTSKLSSWKSKSLWTKIDKRGLLKEYENGNACSHLKVCIIGAGPVGLRLAIECALLGARCIVVEKRDRFSRHNVLHLWPYVITDLKNLGAKVFYGKFATGEIEHISIRQLQCILLKIALVLGVEIYPNVTFIDIIEPISNQTGWRAHFEPENHAIVSTYEFNILIGADGRRNSLKDFKHKEFRGKLAIGITCNFVNHHTRDEQNFEEISGVAKIYKPQFFNELKQQTLIDLENIVYYKNDTHYFVMTAKKQSLIDKGVILQDFSDAARLLARENVNFTKLCHFACEAAQFATKASSQFTFQFAENHHGTADVQMFDFTSLFHAVNASRIIERYGKQLFMALVGDSLLESFWPRGSGAGLGFFGLFDTAWSILKFAKHENPLQILVERESIYMLLSQSTPENTKPNHQLYTINPLTRYQNLNSKIFTIEEIRHLYNSDAIRRTQSSSNDENTNKQDNLLIEWYKEIVNVYEIEDIKALENGLAFCAIIHYYRPDLIDFKSLRSDRSTQNFQLLFDIMENKLSLPLNRRLQNNLLASIKTSIDQRIYQSSIVILQLLYTYFRHEQKLQRRRSSTPAFQRSLPMVSSVDNNNNPANKVSTLVSHYSSNETPSTVNNDNSVSLPSDCLPTFCFYCKEKVSIEDWFVIDNNVLHVDCFQCHTCHLQLEKTNYQIFYDSNTGKTSFHCRYHKFNKLSKKNDNFNQSRFYHDQYKRRSLSFDERNILKTSQFSRTIDSGIPFSLEKDEAAYTSNIINDASTSSLSSEETTTDEDETNEIKPNIMTKTSFSNSDHIRFNSSSQLNERVLTSTKSEPRILSYFRVPCPCCGRSTDDEISIVEIDKQYYHKTCLCCYTCGRELTENGYIYYDLLSDGRCYFYCTLHYCKNRLQQVTTTLATASQQDFQSYSLQQQHNNPTLNNTFSHNFYPVKQRIIPVEYINESKTKKQSPLHQSRRKTLDDFQLISDSKQNHRSSDDTTKLNSIKWNDISSLKPPICPNSRKKKTYRGMECFRARKTSQYLEEELSMSKRCLILENERIRAENEYRQLINLPDERKTMKDKDREERLVIKIAQLVETQDRLSTELDIIRLRSNSNIF